MNVVIDDHLLREVILEREPPWLVQTRGDGHLFTTGSWYYRLCSALQDDEIIGSLSGPIARLPDELRRAVTARVVSLPPNVGLVSLRDSAWNAAQLGRRYGLNLLAAEALATATGTRSALATAAQNLSPRLSAAATAEAINVVVPPT